jgi:hypothetical protein
MRIASAALAAFFAVTAGGVGIAWAGEPSGSNSGANTIFAPTLDSVATVLVFPATNQADDRYGVAAGLIARDLKNAFNANGRYRALEYSPILPAVDRGLNLDSTLSGPDLDKPGASPAKAGKITRVVGDDAYVLSSLTDESYVEVGKKVSVVLSAQIYNAHSDDPVLTISVSGSAVGSPTDSMAFVEASAVKDAANKIAAAFSPKSLVGLKAAPVPDSSVPKRANSGSVLGVVLGAVFAFVVYNNVIKAKGSSATTSTVTGASGSGGGGTISPPTAPTSIAHHSHALSFFGIHF